MLNLRLTVFAVVYASTAALAAESAPPRSIDFSATVTNLDKKPYQDCVKFSDDGTRCVHSEPLTLGKIAAAGLSVPAQRGEAPVPLYDQVARGKLAEQVVDAKSIPLDSKDITLIKDQIAKLGLPPVVVYHAVEMLDPAAAK